MTPEIRAMNAIELAVRRVSSRLKREDANSGITSMLDALSSEIFSMTQDALDRTAAPSVPVSNGDGT